MSDADPLFGLTFANVPIVNLRQEFAYHRQVQGDPNFRTRLLEQHGSVYTEFAAYATKQSFLTNVIQRSISGLESYIRFAATYEAGWERRLSTEFFEKAKNPFRLGGRSIVSNYYDRLPAQIQPSYSLRVANPDLYKLAKRFYEEIRNPLFHGNEVQNDEDGRGTSRALEFVAQVYDWIDSWCPPSRIGHYPPWHERGRKTLPKNTPAVTLRFRTSRLQKPE